MRGRPYIHSFKYDIKKRENIEIKDISNGSSTEIMAKVNDKEICNWH